MRVPDISQLHDYGACSSMMLRNLNRLQNPDNHTRLVNAVTQWIILMTTRLDATETLRDGVYPPHMAFFVVSVMAQQEEAIASLEMVGFSRTGTAFNEKNGTTIFLMYASVDDVLDKLKELYTQHKVAVDARVASFSGVADTWDRILRDELEMDTDDDDDW